MGTISFTHIGAHAHTHTHTHTLDAAPTSGPSILKAGLFWQAVALLPHELWCGLPNINNTGWLFWIQMLTSP